MIKNTKLINSVLTPLLGTLIFALLVVSELTYAESKLDNVQALEWRYRVILVKPNNPCSTLMPIFNEQQVLIKERDILWFVLCSNELRTNYAGELSDAFTNNMKSEYFNELESGTVLIGKDGSIKRTSKKLELTSLFELIDTMPMRRAEMRKEL